MRQMYLGMFHLSPPFSSLSHGDRVPRIDVPDGSCVIVLTEENEKKKRMKMEEAELLWRFICLLLVPEPGASPRVKQTDGALRSHTRNC